MKSDFFFKWINKNDLEDNFLLRFSYELCIKCSNAQKKSKLKE